LRGEDPRYFNPHLKDSVQFFPHSSTDPPGQKGFVVNRDLLIKLRDVIEDIKKLPLYQTWHEAECAEEPGVFLKNFSCGQTYCVLGWAVQESEFAPFVVHDLPSSTSIKWYETYLAVTKALDISRGQSADLFGSCETLDGRLNLIQGLLNENE
jgi:hypothetical protein